MNVVFLLGPEHGNQMTTNDPSSEYNTEKEDNLTGIINCHNNSVLSIQEVDHNGSVCCYS